MRDVPATGSMIGTAPASAGPPRWRRRRYVLDAAYQARSGILVGSTALALLVLLNFSVASHDGAAVSVAGSFVRPTLGSDGRASLVVLVSVSMAFLVGVFLVGLIESHRTAGAAFAIRRAVDAIRDGRTDIRIRLRRHDHLQDLARSINELAEAIDRERGRRG